MAIVYRHRKKGTDLVFYIGIGKNKNRAISSYMRNRHWHYTVDKYGFDVDILAENLSWENAQIMEKELIRQYGRRDLGTGQLVNMTDGGDGGMGTIQSEETKKKRADKIRGMKRSKETCERISKALTGKKQSPEHREKNRLSRIGHIPSPEARKKISEANKGKTQSEKTKLELAVKNSIYRYEKYTLEGVLVETYDNMYTALLSIGKTKRCNCIYNVCLGEAKTAGGYKWKRIKINK